MGIYEFSKLVLMLFSAVAGAWLSAIKPETKNMGILERFATEFYICSGVAILVGLADVISSDAYVAWLYHKGIEFPIAHYALVMVLSFLPLIAIPFRVLVQSNVPPLRKHVFSIATIMLSIFTMLHLYGVDIINKN